MVVRRETVGALIAGTLRRDILFGRVGAGEILSQEAMCQRFDTSRMPVRDALRQLQHEGFLERFSGNRLRVAKLDRNDLLDMFWIEATVHALATKRATERHAESPGEFQRLRTLQVAMTQCALRGDFAEASRLNRSFHKAINFMADSPKLLSTLRTVSMGIQGDFIAEVPEWLSRSIEEHEAIINAMEAGKAERARELMFLHTQGSALKIVDDLGGHASDSRVGEREGMGAALSVLFRDWTPGDEEYDAADHAV